mgnify:CR=1 FL=1
MTSVKNSKIKSSTSHLEDTELVANAINLCPFYFIRGRGVVMKDLQNQKKQNNNKSPKKEQLSEKEMKELMGIYRPTYNRRRGVIRQK